MIIVGGDGVAHTVNDWIADRRAEQDTLVGSALGEETVYGEHIDELWADEASEHAWSAGHHPPPVQEYTEHHSWALVSRWAGIGLGVMVGVAGALLLLVAPPSAAPVEQTALTVELKTADPAPPPPFVMPPDIPIAHETQDGDFLTRMRVAGWNLTSPTDAIEYAHQTCENLARGWTQHEIALGIYEKWGTATMGVAQIEQEGRIAAAVYCPGLN
jgi:Protein of unknown function (DUF732)